MTHTNTALTIKSFLHFHYLPCDILRFFFLTYIIRICSTVIFSKAVDPISIIPHGIYLANVALEKNNQNINKII